VLSCVNQSLSLVCSHDENFSCFPFFPFHILFSHFFTPFLFPLLYLPFFPFPSSLLFFPFWVTILSHISVRGFAGYLIFISIHLLIHKFVPTLGFFLQIHEFASSNIFSPFFTTLTLHFNFCDLHFDHNLTFSLVTGVGLQSIPFFMHTSPTDRSSHLVYFLVISTTAGSRKIL